MKSFTTNKFAIFVATFCALTIDTTAAASNALPAPSQSNFCPQDIKLIQTDGVTSFPEFIDQDPSDTPVTITSQDFSSVTVQLRQQWFPTVDSIHYAFHEHNSREKCHEATSVQQGELYDTINIQCDSSSSPWAELAICLTDNSPNGYLLEGDVAEFPAKCHKVLPGIDHEEDSIKANNKPTVCYSLKIWCESQCIEEMARKRGLRGEHSPNWVVRQCNRLIQRMGINYQTERMQVAIQSI